MSRAAPSAALPPARLQRLWSSRAGLLFFILSIFTGYGAVHSGANLTYLVFGVMLGALLISGVAAAWNLTGVRARRDLPKYAHAAKPFYVTIVLENRAGRLSGFSLKAHDKLPPDLHILESRCYALRVLPRRKAELEYLAVCHKRGLHRFTQLTVSSRFPFGFFANQRGIKAPDEIIVYPRIGKIRVDLAEIGGGLEYAEGTQVSRREGTEDFYGLREFRPGDNPRRIHWKRSARLQKPLIMQFVQPPERDLDVYLDTYVSPGLEERLEPCVSLAATLFDTLLKAGYSIGLKLPGHAMFQSGGSWSGYHSVMRSLALVQPSSRGLTPEEVQTPVSNQAVLILPEPSREQSLLAAALRKTYARALILPAATAAFDSFFDPGAQP